MNDTRPVLVGMNNPLSSKPEHALYPAPERVTGWNIWRMLHETCGMTRQEYLRAFDRRNLVDGVMWNRGLAKERAPRLWSELDGRVVAFLGREVADIMSQGVGTLEPLVWATPMGGILQDGGPARVCLIPHPSGLNHWYNNPTNRAAAALRLEQMYEDWKNAVVSA